MTARHVKIMIRSLVMLRRYRLRSALTVAGAALGVAGVVCPVNYGASGSKQLLDQIRRMGTNVLVITPVQSKAIAGRARTGNLVTTLVERDRGAIEHEIASLVRSSAVVTGGFWIKAGDLSKNLAVVGVQTDYFAIRNWSAESGALFPPSDDRTMARVALLGHTVATDLFDTESPVGRRLMLNRIPFTVIGVLAERGQGLDVSNEDDQVYIPLATAMHRVMNLDHYSAIALEINEAGAMDAAAAQTASILRQRHRLHTNQADDFRIQNQEALLETQAAAASRLRFFLSWIGGSALAVSGLGILGITWIVIKERTRDFGTCRALGATAQDIFFQVWFESTVLALSGVCVGLLIVWPSSRWIAVFSNLPFIFERTTAVLAFLSATALNLAFSILPSRKAALVHPIEALRQE